MCVIEERPIIETQRLTLRVPAKADIERVAAFCVDHDVARMTTRMPSPYTRAHAEDFVARCRAQNRTRENTFAIDLVDEGLIGVVGLFPPVEGGLELGYWIGRPYWGRGYATEAARALLAACTPDAVDATIDPANLASWRILEKLGFIVVGEEEDEYGLPTLRLHLEIGESAAAG